MLAITKQQYQRNVSAVRNTKKTSGPSLSARILDCYDDLSKRERLLADTVLACAQDLAGYTATELAVRAKVSKATATRFFRRLGYRDYEGARLEARQTPHWGSPLEAFYNSTSESDDEVSKHLRREIENITKTFGPGTAQKIEKCVVKLASAERIWIIGFRDNYPIAAYASTALTRVKDVRLLPNLGMSLAEDLSGIQRKDVVLAFGFRRWPSIFVKALKLIHHDLGVPVILITDVISSISPVVPDVELRCHIKGSSIFDSHTAGLSMVNLICSRVARRLGKATRTRLQAVEKYHSELGDFRSPTNRSINVGKR
jgi:DNA-binding MurR/RpiR family transcriptional regulator